MFKKIAILIAALVIAVAATIYEQTISTYRPEKVKVVIAETSYSFWLPATHEGMEECVIELNAPDSALTGKVLFRLHNSDVKWNENKLIRLGDKLITILPYQRPLVKLEYYLEMSYKGEKYTLRKEDPVVVRFQNEIPKALVYPYGIIFFITLILAMFSGILAVYNIDSFRKFSITVFYFLCAVLVLSVIIQLLATSVLFVQFSPYNDLKLYRNLIMIVFWLWAFNQNRKKEARWATIVASAITLLCFALPRKLLFGVFFE